MRDRFSSLRPIMVVVGIAISIAISLSLTPASAQAISSTESVPALVPPWDEPDLQGIWTDETDTPVQRSPTYANQEFFTEAGRPELDRQRAAMPGRERRAERGTVA